MRRKVMLFIIVFLLTINPVYASIDAQETDILIELNEEILMLEEAPYIFEGRTLVPVRYIFEPLGLEVLWDQENRIAIGKKEGLVIELPIDSVEATVNGEVVILDAPAVIINSRSYVPLRFVAESTGAIVKWNSQTRTASIYHGDYPVAKDYSSLTVVELLVSIYEDSNSGYESKSEEIRDKYLEIKSKLSLESNNNNKYEDEFKSALNTFAASLDLVLDDTKSINDLMIEFDKKRNESITTRREKVMNDYEVYNYDGGDKYYGSIEDGKVSGYGLYEFESGDTILGNFKDSKINGYADNAYSKGYNYGHFENGLKENYEFSYFSYETSELLCLTEYSNDLKKGKSYEVRLDLEGNILYSRHLKYVDNSEVGLSEIFFSDGTRRHDIETDESNEIVVRVDKDGDYFILPTDEKGKSIESRTGFGYKSYVNGIEYIGEFFEESKLGDGIYYGVDDSSNLSSNLMDLRANEIIESIISDVHTDEQKIKIIHDYLATHIRYDPAENEDFPQISHMAYGAIVDGVAVCDGYSEAFKYLLNKVGIESIIVFGEAYADGTPFTEEENHAWNIIKVEDVYYHYDLTWGDDDLNNMIHYEYFKENSESFSTTHWWNTENYIEFLK